MEEEVFGFEPKGSDEAEEIRRLKRELARVTEERDILKKAGRVLRQGCKVKYAFIALHRLKFSVRTMCWLLYVHPSGFYAWLKKPLSKRACEDKRQTDLLFQAWQESGKVYGYPLAGRRLLRNRREAQAS